MNMYYMYINRYISINRFDSRFNNNNNYIYINQVYIIYIYIYICKIQIVKLVIMYIYIISLDYNEVKDNGIFQKHCAQGKYALCTKFCFILQIPELNRPLS